MRWVYSFLRASRQQVGLGELQEGAQRRSMHTGTQACMQSVRSSDCRQAALLGAVRHIASLNSGHSRCAGHTLAWTM